MVLELAALPDTDAVAWFAEMDAARKQEDAAYWQRPPGVSFDESGLRTQVEQSECFSVTREGTEVGRLAFERFDLGGVRYLSISAIWVRPDLRGAGLGRLLVHRAESEVRARREHRLTATVASSNRKSLALFQDTGFRTWLQFLRVDPSEPVPVRPLRLTEVVSADELPQGAIAQRQLDALRQADGAVLAARRRGRLRGVVALSPGSGRDPWAIRTLALPDAPSYGRLLAGVADHAAARGWPELMALATRSQVVASRAVWPTYAVQFLKAV